jgi:hypothetical protein
MTMPIDLGQVDWLYVAILALFCACRKLDSELIVLSTPWPRCRHGSGAVCRSFRVMDLLPARSTTAHHAEGSKVYGHDHQQPAC